MNKLLTAGETLRTLRDLRVSVRRILQKESEICRDRDRDRDAVARKYALLKSRIQNLLTEKAAEQRRVWEAKREQCQAQTKARSAWIEAAFHRAKLLLEKSADQIRTQQQYENQKELLRANKNHDEQSAASEKVFRDCLRELDEEEMRFESMQERFQNAFCAYARFQKGLHKDKRNETDAEHAIGIEALREELAQLENGLEKGLRISPATLFVRFYSLLPIWFWLGGLLTIWLIIRFVPQISQIPQIAEVIANHTILQQWFIGLGGIVMATYASGFWLGRGVMKEVSERLSRSFRLIKACRNEARQRHEQALTTMKEALAAVESRLEMAWHKAQSSAQKHKQIGMKRLEERRFRLLEKNTERGKRWLMNFGEGGSFAIDSEDRSLKEMIAEQAQIEAEIEARFDKAMAGLIGEWEATIPDCIERIERSQSASLKIFPQWNSDAIKHWQAHETGEALGIFAHLNVDLDRFVEMPSKHSKHSRLAWSPSIRLLAPLAMKMPLGESLLVESESAAPQKIIESFNALILRLLSSSPLGRLRLTFIDPVALGRNFAGLMHLADHDDRLVHRRIWTQSGQIEECLRDLTEHMERVVQMFLRNEYRSLAEYNAAAGTIAEKYHLLIVADFPAGFSETALARLQSIASSGARCGVFLILHRDKRKPILEGSIVEDLRKQSVWMDAQTAHSLPAKGVCKGVSLQWETMPEAKVATKLVHQIGAASADSNRVKVPFDCVAPPENRLWSLETAEGLRVPIGRSGAAKLQYLCLGKGTQQHAIIAGKTGSGKSTLFHVIVSNLALWCAPDRVEFYLVDFKKGVEFKCYATTKLPHARVIAIQSDREFGLSVLERIDAELRKRGDLFRECGVQDLAGYHRARANSPLPRTLLLIDEFQEYFVEEDRIAQNAAVLLDRIVRQGRAFGIHVILGSQTLGGAYTLARTTLAQMTIRIALQCDEVDSYFILDENNSAARLLSRPGEGIYNDSGGMLEGNSPFQTVWLSDEERAMHLKRLHSLAMNRDWRGEPPVIFEGNAPAKIEENRELAECLSHKPKMPKGQVHAWLGAAGAIQKQTRASFDLRSASHLLIIGQNEESALSIVLCGILSLASQYHAEAAEFVILDAFPEDSPQRERLDQVIDLLPQPVRTLRMERLETIMNRLNKQIDSDLSSTKTASEIWLIILGLQSFKQLRARDEFDFSQNENAGQIEPASVLDRILQEGSNRHIRLMATIDSYNSSQRFFTRKALSEIEMRVLFQMSANDSAALIDGTQASRLGLYRALFSHERKGSLEMFRPYAMPSQDWLNQVKTQFAHRQSQIEKPIGKSIGKSIEKPIEKPIGKSIEKSIEKRSS